MRCLRPVEDIKPKRKLGKRDLPVENLLKENLLKEENLIEKNYLEEDKYFNNILYKYQMFFYAI